MCAISGIANIRGDRNAVPIVEAMNHETGEVIFRKQ